MDDASAPVLFSAKTKKNVPPIKQKSDRPREYLRPDEVEVLIKAARKVGRHGHRDAAMILLMYRHGLRTAELISLKWSQVDLKHGYLDVKRVKNGHDSIHPLRSTELRALRQVKRDYPENPYVFISERQAPISSRSVRAIVARAGEEADFPFTLHPHQFVTLVGII